MSLLNFVHREGQLRGVHARNDKTSRFQVDTEESREDNENTAGENSQDADTGNQESAQVYEVLEREILPAKIICPDCGGITLEGLEFCDKCGGELQ